METLCCRGDQAVTLPMDHKLTLCYKLIFRHVKSPRILRVAGSPENKSKIRNKGYTHKSSEEYYDFFVHSLRALNVCLQKPALAECARLSPPFSPDSQEIHRDAAWNRGLGSAICRSYLRRRSSGLCPQAGCWYEGGRMFQDRGREC